MDGFDEVIFEVEIAVLSIFFYVDEKGFEVGGIVFELFHEGHGVGEIVEILEVDFEEVDLFF